MQLLKPGSRFGGRYEIVRTLSAGGMGVVYEVLHSDTQRRRAMKVMLPQMLANEDMRARFKREGVVTAGIESEHLVEVFDVGVDDESGAPFLVMELLRGEDLGARLSRGERTRPAELLELFEQLTRGLERTHEAGIVHRDLKPENLFVTRRDDGASRIKILDFGIAKLVDQKSKATATVGTPLYMAPEQMTGESARMGPATDLYSLGHIAYTLLVGRPYFQPESETSDSVLGFMFKVAQGTVETATQRGAAQSVTLPEPFDAWFSRATETDPAKRFPSARAQLEALREALRGAPEELPTSSNQRRVVAFQATQPVGETAPPQVVSAKSVGRASVDSASGEASLLQGAVGAVGGHAGNALSASGPVPSSRTLGTPFKPAPVRGRSPALWIGAGVLLIGGAALTGARLMGSSDPPPAGSSGAVEPSTASKDPVAAPGGTLAPPSPHATVIVDAASTVSVASSAPVVSSASGRASATADVSSPRASTAAPPRTAGTSAPSRPPPATPTVWGGPRR